MSTTSATPSTPPNPDAPRRTRAQRRKQRNLVIGGVVASLVVAATVVIAVVSVNAGRSGTLASGVDGIESFSPDEALINAEVHIVGSGFAEATDVRFNGVSVNSFNRISDTEIATLVPDGATSGPITVETPNGDLVSTESFTVRSPIIGSFAPTSAGAGETLRIVGANLGDVTTVRINGKETPATAISDTQVTAVIPANAQSGKVTVVNPESNATSTVDLTVTSPSITGVDPPSGVGGTEVTLTGAELDGMSAVSFNNVPGTVVSASTDGTSAVVKAPANVTAGKITVTTANGTTTSDISFQIGPVITSFSPNSGVPGTTVTINGKNLTNTASITFAGAIASGTNFTVVSDTQITTVVPPEADTGPITITADGTTTSAQSFTVGAYISNFWPESAPVGATVTVYGSGLRKTTGARIGSGSIATVTVVDDTKLTFVVPTGSVSGNIRLSTTFGTTSIATSGSMLNIAGTTPAVDPYDRAMPIPQPFTPPSGLPAGGTDFAKSGTITIAGIVITPTPPSATTTTAATTTTVKAIATTSTVKISTAPTTTAAAPSTTAGAPTTTTGSGTSTAAPSTTSAPTTTVPQTPYNGTATVQIGNSSKFTATVSYTSPSKWSITPATGTTITVPIAAKTLTINTLTGNISALDGQIFWGISGKTVSSALVANKFTFNAGAIAAFSGVCPPKLGAKLCESSGPFLEVDGLADSTGFSAAVGNVVPTKNNLAYQAGIDLSNGRINLEATYPVDNPVTVTNGTLKIAYKDDSYAVVNDDVVVETGSANGGLDIVFTGKSLVDIPYIGRFNPPSVTVWYLDGGSMLTLDFPNKRVIAEASMSTAVFVFGHGSPVTARVLGEPKQLADGTWVFLGSMRLPTYIRKSFGTGDEGEVAAVATMTGNGIFELKALFSTPLDLPKLPYLETKFEGFSVAIRRNESDPGLSAEIALGASGSIKIAGNEPMGVMLEAAVAFTEAGTEYSVALTGSGEDGRAAWPDVLGVPGFDIDRFSIEVGITPVYPFVSVGLAGTGTLPNKLLEYMGAERGLPTPANFVVNLSSTSPCLEVEAGTPDGENPIIRFPKDVNVLEVTYFKISASAHGCMVGIFDVPAGVMIAEKAEFLGVKRDFLLVFNPNPTGPSKTPSFYGWDKVTASSDRGAIKFRYRLTWGAGGWNFFPYFSIDGSLKLGSNNEISVSGGCQFIVSPMCSAKGNGRINLGMGLSASMEVIAEGIGTPATTYAATGDINLFGLKFGLAGNFTSSYGAPLGWDFSATADLPGKTALLDKISVRVGYGLRRGFSTCNGLPCLKWLTDPLFALTVEGNTGGLMKVINGAADAFGLPPTADGGRYKLREEWKPTMTEITFGGSSSFSLGSLGTVDTSLYFSMCLTSDCFGKVDADFDLSVTKAKKTFSFASIPLGEDWNFDYAASMDESFYESGQVGDNWGGLKGTVSGSITLGIDVDSSPLSVSFTVKASLSARGYIGAGGKWNSVGSIGVSFDSSSGRACFSYSGEKVCVG